jgi:hypothetical protein
MLVTVEDGTLVNIRGDRDNPDSHGFLYQRGPATRQIIATRNGCTTPCGVTSVTVPGGASTGTRRWSESSKSLPARGTSIWL